MVGMNLSGIVSGSELKQVTQEIFGKAQGFTPKNPKPSKKQTTAQATKISQALVSRSGNKATRAGFNQSNVEMSEAMQSMVKSQAAIDRYGQLSFRNANIKELETGKHPELADAERLTDAYGAKKDRDGKNPFAFFEQAPQEKETPIENEFSKSIFDLGKSA